MTIKLTPTAKQLQKRDKMKTISGGNNTPITIKTIGL